MVYAIYLRGEKIWYYGLRNISRGGSFFSCGLDKCLIGGYSSYKDLRGIFEWWTLFIQSTMQYFRWVDTLFTKHYGVFLRGETHPTITTRYFYVWIFLKLSITRYLWGGSLLNYGVRGTFKGWVLFLKKLRDIFERGSFLNYGLRSNFTWGGNDVVLSGSRFSLHYTLRSVLRDEYFYYYHNWYYY